MSKKKIILFIFSIMFVISYLGFLLYTINQTYKLKSNEDEPILIEDMDVIDNIDYNIPPVIREK